MNHAEKADTSAALPGSPQRKTVRGIVMEQERKKDYVRFYYFWITQYAGRFEILKKEELDKERKESLSKFFIEYCENCKNVHKIINENEFIAKEKRICFVPRLCKEECIYADKLNKISEEQEYKYNEIELYSRGWRNPREGTLWSGETIISGLTEGEDLEWLLYDCEGRQGSYGVKLIGGNDITLDDQGKIKNKLIFEIDFSVPNNIIFAQLDALKNKKYTLIPTFLTIQNQLELNAEKYDIEYEMIKSLSGDKFNHNNFISRALGIYIWDSIHTTQWDDMPTTQNGGKCKDVKNSIELLLEKTPDILDTLGYSNSELTVFRRLYRKTKECIEKCEVLSMR